MHCHAGLGRTGICIAAILIVRNRLNALEAISFVRAHRCVDLCLFVNVLLLLLCVNIVEKAPFKHLSNSNLLKIFTYFTVDY